MIFEYNPIKSRVNKEKHGIDFEEAKQIWNGLYVVFSAKCEIENRFAIIGPVNNKLYICIYCLRDEKIRIISCRRPRKGEVDLYEKSFKNS